MIQDISTYDILQQIYCTDYQTENGTGFREQEQEKEGLKWVMEIGLK